MHRSATRPGKASSPPGNQAAARTRRSRSRSVELGTTSRPQGPSRRSKRQSSAESATSNGSDSHKPMGKGAKAVPELSIVQEGSDSDSGSEDIESIHNDANSKERASSSEESSQDMSDPEFQDQPQAGQKGQGSSEQNFNSKGAAKRLKELWKAKATPTEAAVSLKHATVASSSSSRQAQLGPSLVQTKVTTRRLDEGNGPPGSSIEDIYGSWEQETSDKNKENKRPTEAPPKRRLIDRHPAAYKVPFESQGDAPVPTNRKRRFEGENERPAEADDDEDEDDDDEDEESQEFFQTDGRDFDKSRKLKAQPVAQTSAPTSSKRARHENHPQFSAPDLLPSRQVHDEEYDARSRNSDSPESQPFSTQVKIVGKKNVQLATLSDRKFQTRTPWSDHDEALLIEYIEKYGCSWAFISQQPGWQLVRPNFQVQLKDKARNIKVAYLKARARLPTNFHQVRLGKKELAIVHRVDPDYDQNHEA